MSGRTKRLVITVALMLVSALAYPTFLYSRDLHAALTQGYLAARWLQMPVAKTPAGVPITRIQLIDIVLEKEAAQLQLQWLLKKPAAN